MDLLRTDLVAIYDLRFERVGQVPWPLLRESDSRIASRLNESFGWIFYGEQLRSFDVFDLSQVFPDSIGAALRINRQSGVGSALVWRITDGKTDPLAFKMAPWQQANKASFLSSGYSKG